MQTLDIHRPEMPDLQFVLLVTALCTSRLTVLNIPYTLRTAMFDRCWVLIHESPPPRRPEARVLDLRTWNELTVEAMAETIRAGLIEAGIHTLAWDHQPPDVLRCDVRVGANVNDVHSSAQASQMLQGPRDDSLGDHRLPESDLIGHQKSSGGIG